jgi:hypothetical protein
VIAYCAARTREGDRSIGIQPTILSYEIASPDNQTRHVMTVWWYQALDQEPAHSEEKARPQQVEIDKPMETNVTVKIQTPVRMQAIHRKSIEHVELPCSVGFVWPEGVKKRIVTLLLEAAQIGVFKKRYLSDKHMQKKG